MGKFSSTRSLAWFVILTYLAMALGSVFAFIRMAPAIEVIIDHNGRSQHASERMLASLAASSADGLAGENREAFLTALSIAENNITEEGETAVIAAIKDLLQADPVQNRTALIEAVLNLSEINREAMLRADEAARHLGAAGAWGVVALSLVGFGLGMILLRRIDTDLILPLEQIHTVFRAHLSGDRHLRCARRHLPRPIRSLFGDINSYLDETMRMDRKPEEE